MSISLQVLETALTAIEEIGQEELTFPVGSMTITLRALLPEQEITIQKYAAAVIHGGGEDDQATVVEYLDRFQVETIAQALVQIDDLDLRGVAYIETGEMMDDGKTPIRIPRNEALRQLIRKWNGNIRSAVFGKYSELRRKVEEVTEQAIEFEPSDDDAEIERLETQLEELKRQKAHKEMSEAPTQMDAINALSDMDADIQAQAMTMIAAKKARRQTVEVETPEPEPPSPAAPRQPLVPGAATPPMPVSQQAVTQSHAEPAPPAVLDSFVDPVDLEEATAAEHQRLVQQRALRQQQMAAARAQAALEAGVSPDELPPPHVAAAQAQAELEDSPTQNAVQIGQVGKAPIFSQPAEELSRTAPRARGVPVNPKGQLAAGTTNPRFRPPGR